MRRLPLCCWLLISAGVLLACANAGRSEAARSDEAPGCDRPLGAAVRAVPFVRRQAVVYTEEEQACWLPWDLARAAAEAPGGQWVDVRDAGQRQRLALEGVMAVDLADLPDKPFLKEQSLVLVGTGVDLPELSRQCVLLRQSGQYRSVHVLLGGAHAWRQAGRAVSGSQASLPADQVDAQEMWQGAGNGAWRLAVLDMPPAQVRELADRLPAAAQDVADLGADAAHAVRQLHALARQPLPAPRQWLVIAGSPERLAQARQFWQEQQNGQKNAQNRSSASAVMWLAGGWPAYAEYVQQQAAVAAHAGQPLPPLCGI